MLVVKKVSKSDLPRLIEYKLLTILPYCKSEKEKLKVIEYANQYMNDNYLKAKLIIYNFKIVGAYIIDEGSLDLLYVERKYRFKKIGTKILKRMKRRIECIKVVEGNENGIRFCKKNGFDIYEKKKGLIVLRRVDASDD